MATITTTPSVIKTFRTKRDAQDWARRIEDEMVRGYTHLRAEDLVSRLDQIERR